MKKRVYFIDFKSNWGDGIENKIKKQISLFTENVGKCDRVILEKKNLSPLVIKILLLFPFTTVNDYKKLYSIPKNQICYIRYNKIDFMGINAIRMLKKNNNIVIVEIPTYPYDHEQNGKIRFLYYKDKICRNFLTRYVDRIVTYSNDKKIWNIPTISISNAISTEDIVVRNKQKCTEEINLIAVATLQFWHGYDRIINGLYEYYKYGGKRKVIFHLIGDGSLLESYKKMVDEKKMSDYIRLYGRKYGNELDEIYNIADIAIDSLARHRSGVFYNSSLKGKEYLAKGLPIVSGVKTELDFCNDFKYYMRVPADDSPVEIDDIVKFYDNIYGNEDYNNVTFKIRKFCERNFSYKKSYSKVISFMTKME